MPVGTHTPFYKGHKNTILDETGKQISVILPVNCTKRETNNMAAYVTQHMNQGSQDKEHPDLDALYMRAENDNRCDSHQCGNSRQFLFYGN